MSLRGPKVKALAFILGLIALVAGFHGTFFQTRGFEKTTATIVSITETESSTPDNRDYEVTVEYTVGGTQYQAALDSYSAGYKEGRQVTVLYDPADPGRVYGSRGFSIYFMVVGAIILAVVLFSEVSQKRSLAAVREVNGENSYKPPVSGTERELYFLTDQGTPKYGHRLEDRERRVLYEAKMTKYTLATPFGFDFIDREHGVTTPHLVGHTEESQWDTLLIDNNSTFSFDGEDIWKHLKRNGIRVETSYTAGKGSLIGMTYRIFRDGSEIAKAVSTSQFVHEEDAEANKALSAIPAQGFYRVWTGEKNLDLLFVTLLAFARSGAGDDRGGNYGALWGTLKKAVNKE